MSFRCGFGGTRDLFLSITLLPTSRLVRTHTMCATKVLLFPIHYESAEIGSPRWRIPEEGEHGSKFFHVTLGEFHAAGQVRERLH